MFDFLGNSFGGKRSSDIIVFVFEIRACLLFVNSGPGIDVKKKKNEGSYMVYTRVVQNWRSSKTPTGSLYGGDHPIRKSV